MDDKKNILLVTPFWGIDFIQGGIAVYVKALAETLSKYNNNVVVAHFPFTITGEIKYSITNFNERGHRYKVYAFYGSAINEELVISNHMYRWSKNTYTCIKGFEIILGHESKFDIVHINDYFGAPLIEICKITYKIPIICTMHAWSSIPYALADSLRRYTVLNADLTLTVSDYLSSCLIEKYEPEVQKSKMLTIHNGVYPSRTDRRCFRKEDKLVFCGRLTELKSVTILIEAIAKLNRRGYCFDALIIGHGPEREKAQRLSIELGVGSQVKFLGVMSNEEVRNIFANSFAHVICSQDETFGLTALESMAEGTCVVSSFVGGLKEFIQDGENGFFYPYGDSDRLCDIIIKLKENPSIKSAVEAAAENTAKRMNWTEVAMRLMKCYERVIQEFDPEDKKILGKGV